jgi:hypothetical protein
MSRLLPLLTRTILVLVLAGAVLAAWLATLGRDDGRTPRPAYGAYAWTDVTPATPRGGPVPRPDGYVIGSQGHDFILPPMPPERPTDVHRRDTVAANARIATCFWPGPRLRSGFYTTDPDDYGIENQLPDTMNTFDTAWFRLPAGATLVLKGEFPHMRHWSFTTYSENGVPRDVLDDVDIDPDAGSANPFRPGVPRDAGPRRYTFTIASGTPPAQRPRNTLYTLAEPGAAIGMHMRNYVPDRGRDFLGGVPPPQVELHRADGSVLAGDEACAATLAPLRAKQVPLTVPRTLWLALNRLPWRPVDRTPAHDFSVEPLEKFYNREYLLLQTFFPVLAFDRLAVEKGGFWSNLSTRYGYKYLSQAYGKVYVVRGRMPSVPRTWSGDAVPMDHGADMRYWSMCTVASPPTGFTVDCLFDEAVLPTVDDRGEFTVVVSRAPDRPSNATDACGVAWMEWGNGDGLPGGSADFGAIINRHTQVNPSFRQSWFAVDAPGREAQAMGAYLPWVLNLREKARFEALGCPVDKAALRAMVAGGASGRVGP